MAVLGCLISGLLTVLLWFELASTTGMTSGERAAFILAALTETILFITSILGLIGAITRKQSFIQVYVYVLYVHFVINFVAATYLLFQIFQGSNNLEVLACQAAIKNSGTQNQCTDLLSIARWIYLVVALSVLFVELYGAVIATRYLNQLQRQKRAARASRVQIDKAFQLNFKRFRYRSLPDQTPDSYSTGPEFNPYGGEVPFVDHRHESNDDGAWTPNNIEENLDHENELRGGLVDQQQLGRHKELE